MRHRRQQIIQDDEHEREWCGTWCETGNHRARFCSNACRQAAHPSKGGIRWKTALFAILFALAFALAAQADVKAGELYGYRIGDLFELAETTDRREYPSRKFPFLSVEAKALDAPKFVDHVWLELTPLTYEIMGIRTVIPVKDEVEGRALVDP